MFLAREYRQKTMESAEKIQMSGAIWNLFVDMFIDACDSLTTGNGKTAFIDDSEETGKTFLINLVLAKVTVCLAITDASLWITTTLLPGSR